MDKTEKTLRITFLLPGYPTIPIGGFRIVYQYANEMVFRGHVVTVIHPLRVPPLENTKQKTQAHAPNILKIIWRKLRNYRIYVSNPSPNRWQTIDSRIKMIYHFETPSISLFPDADVLIATSAGTTPYVEQAPSSKGEKFYFIQHFETVMGNSEEAILKTWRTNLKKIVISKWLQNIGIEHGITEISYIPNAIDHQVFKINSDDSNMSGRTDKILSLWHDSSWKGSKDALEAMCLVHSKYPDLKMSFFGTSERPRMLPEWIGYFRDPSQADLVKIYNAHSIFVNASKFEGFGLTPMEAMACGCCFVGTMAGGFLDYAVNDENALLSPIEDPLMLAENILRIIESPALLSKLRQRGLTDVQEFTWSKSAEAFERVLCGFTTR